MRIRLYYIMFFIVSLSACEKIMEEGKADLSDLSDKEQMNLAINGLYNRCAHMHQAFYYYQALKGDDMTYVYYGNRAYAHNEPPVDSSGRLVLHGPATYESGGGFGSFEESEKPLLIWKKIYSTITSANNIIDKYEKEKVPEDLYTYVGEAYFFRAYCYFRLVRLFGEGPLVTDVDVNYSLTTSSPREIYVQIEKDLKKAIQLLPGNNDQARVPYITPHRGTAKALLAEVYLTKGGYPVNDYSSYALAAETAGEVIDSAGFFGFALLPDYANVWNGINNANTESVFSLNYAYFGEFNVSVLPEETLLYPDEVLNLVFFNETYIITETNFYNCFPADYRRDITYMNHLTGKVYQVEYIPGYYDSITGMPMFDTIATFDFDHYYDTIAINDNICYLKQHIYPQNPQLPLFSSDNYQTTNYDEKVNDMNLSLYVYRYPHVLLTFAEAKARSGGLDEKAYEAVNQVRRRANRVDIFSPSVYDLTPGLSAGQFADSVVWERAWEFAGEFEGRWFDLVRLEKVEELGYIRHNREQGFPEGIPTKEDYYLAIPAEELLWLE